MGSSWWEIQVLCDPNLEELIFWRLDRFGCRGVARQIQGQDFLIKSYIPRSQVNLLDLGALSLWLRQDAMSVEMPIPRMSWHGLEEEDWSSSWKQHWQPEEIGDRLLICPAWLDVPVRGDRLNLRLDPGVAFGTGAHATTQLCLESLEMRLGDSLSNSLSNSQSGQLIADIGCGSGILSLGALLLGAGKVYAVDTDPLAVQATQDNQQLNGFGGDRLITGIGSLNELKALAGEETRFDGIVCNILADVILELIPELESISKPTTWGVLSGILLTQAQEIAAVLEAHGWIAATLWKRKEWCCFNIRRDPDVMEL